MAVGDIHIEGSVSQNFNIYKNLGHSSLNSNVLNINVKFQAYVVHSKRDIYVKKNKSSKINVQIYSSVSQGNDYAFIPSSYH